MGFPGAQRKESTCNTGRCGFDSLGGEDPLRAWKLAPVFLSGELRAQRSLVGDTVHRGHQGLDTFEMI